MCSARMIATTCRLSGSGKASRGGGSFGNPEKNKNGVGGFEMSEESEDSDVSEVNKDELILNICGMAKELDAFYKEHPGEFGVLASSADAVRLLKGIGWLSEVGILEKSEESEDLLETRADADVPVLTRMWESWMCPKISEYAAKMGCRAAVVQDRVVGDVLMQFTREDGVSVFVDIYLHYQSVEEVEWRARTAFKDYDERGYMGNKEWGQCWVEVEKKG